VTCISFAKFIFIESQCSRPLIRQLKVSTFSFERYLNTKMILHSMRFSVDYLKKAGESFMFWSLIFLDLQLKF